MQRRERSWGRDGRMNQHRMTELLQDRYGSCLAWPKRIIGGWWLFGPVRSSLWFVTHAPRPCSCWGIQHVPYTLCLC
jgi:hypothetical protein